MKYAVQEEWAQDKTVHAEVCLVLRSCSSLVLVFKTFIGSKLLVREVTRDGIN